LELKTLNTAEVLQIHEALTSDFSSTGDPISPSGVRSNDLLESAVARQLTGYDRTLKYPRPIDNAATLLYGICCDHPFYNGNKRTALVAMLVHLDKNKLTFCDTSQKELYDFMIEVADHRIIPKKKKHTEGTERVQCDEEVAAISKWVSLRIRNVRRGEKLITYRELRRILESFGYQLDNPHGNSIDIIRHETVRKGLIVRREEKVAKRVGNMSWPGEGPEVALKEIKRVREICRLREEDGVDSDSFYNTSIVIDSFVNRYRTTLRRLAKA
jgi:death on curing protein